MLMRTVTAAVAAFAGLGLAEARQHRLCNRDLEDFIARQSEISIAGVLANIGPDGSEVVGIPAGVVVASPSRSDPDCAPSLHTLTCSRR